MGKSRRKKCRTIKKSQFMKMMWNGEWKSFIDSVLEESCHDLNTKKTIEGYTFLSCATELGRKEIVEYLIKYGAGSSITNVDGSIPLHIAAQHDHMDLLEIFINLSVFVDSRDKMNRTPLHYVTGENYRGIEIYWHKLCLQEKEHVELASFLVRHGADIDARDSKENVPILLAAKHSCKAVVELLVREGANIQFCDSDKWTVLHYASFLGWLDVVYCLVERGANLNAKTLFGDTSLLLAAKKSYEEVVELLIKSGGNVNSCDMDKTTTLHYASREGWLNVVKLLVEHKADINAKTNFGSTPVMLAVKRKHWDIFNFLVKSGADLVGCEDKTTILHYACEAGWVEAVRSIVDSGSDIDAQTQDGETPLLIAAKHADKEILDILLKSEASLYICGPDSLSLPHYACRNGWIDLLQHLVEAGWDINSITPDGRTSLMVAAENNHLKLFEYLLELGADIDAKMIPCEWKSEYNDSCYDYYNSCNDYHIYDWDMFDYDDIDDEEDVFDVDGWTILHHASSTGQLPLVQFLIRKGAYVNGKISKGFTPLHLAVQMENLEIVKYLLTAGADVDVKTSDGATPLYFAVQNKNLEIVSQLLKAGADIDGKTSDGATILCLAIINDSMEIVVHLLKEGANCNEKNDNTAFYSTGTAFECYVEDMYQREEYLPLFFEKGAYITDDTYSSLMECERFKENVLKNVEFCSQAILNKFNNLDLHQMYQVPFAVKNLPPIKRMKLGSDSYLAKCIKDSVIHDIEANGYCNIPKIQPLVLSVLAAKAFNNHFRDIIV